MGEWSVSEECVCGTTFKVEGSASFCSTRHDEYLKNHKTCLDTRQIEMGTKKKEPTKPKWPISRMEREGDLPDSPKCPLCDSSLAYKIWPFRSKKCIQPKCENYYKKKGNQK